MGAEEKGVNVPISSSFDPAGTNQAKSALSDVGEAGQEAAGEVKELKESFTELATALGEMLAFAEFVDLIRDSVKDFYENEKAIRGVGTAALALGMDVPKVKKEVEEWSEAMGRASGVSNDQLSRAMGQQLTLTGDLEQAQTRVKLAMDFSTATGVSFSEGMQVVNAVIHGQTRALVGVVPGVIRHMEATEAQALGMKFLESTIRGATERLHDNALEADKATERWNQFKEKLGGQVAPVLTQFREILMTIPQTLTLISDLSVVWAESVQRNVAAVGHFLRDVWKDPSNAAKTFMAERIADEVATAAAVSKAYEQNKKEFIAAEKAKVDAVKNTGNERLKVDNLVAANEVHITDTSKEQERLLWEYRKSLFLKNQVFMQAAAAQELADFRDAEFKKLQIEAKTREVTDKLIKETLKKKKEAAKQELEMQVAVANAAVGLATDLFGSSKETAVASAIINTYEGATKALAQGGIYGAVLAAIVIAAGLAQVAKIESAEPASSNLTTSGSGFDDPTNDEAAKQGGRRWANDMINKFTKGVGEGWAQGMGAGQSTVNNDNRRTINVTMQGGAPADPTNVEWMKKFSRSLKMVEQNVNGQATIARRR